MNISVILPLLGILVWMRAISRSRPDEGLRVAFMIAAVSLGVFVVLVTEVLSLWQGVRQSVLALAWFIAVGAGAFVNLKLPRSEVRRSLREILPAGRWSALLLVGGTLTILLVTALIARVAPPNNWDSLNYHMSRVARWAQEGSIHPYATGIEFQNYMPPANAIFMLQAYVLGGGDAWVNFIQWGSMLGCLIAVSYLANRLGAGAFGGWAAVVFTATLPMGIMQATSSTSDYVLAFWLVIVAALVVRDWQEDVVDPVRLVTLAAAAGLAFLTKQTSLPYLAVFGIIIAVSLRRKVGLQGALKWALIGLAVVTAINIGHAVRNMQTYGSPAGPQARVELHLNNPIGFRSFISSLLKQASLHAGTPSPYWNKGVALTVAWVHEQLGIELNDPGLTAEGVFRVKGQVHHETVAGNFPQAVFMLGFVLLSIPFRRKISSHVNVYGWAVVSGLLVFVLVFSWKITGSRYHLPAFVLFGPTAGALMDRWKNRNAANIILAVMLAWSVPWLIGNQARPLISGYDEVFTGSVLTEERGGLYYANGLYLQRPYSEMAALINESGCSSVGLSLLGNSAEYPLWVLLDAPRYELEIAWIVAGTPSAQYEDAGFQPCAVICEQCPEGWETLRELPVAYERPPYRLYLER